MFYHRQRYCSNFVILIILRIHTHMLIEQKSIKLTDIKLHIMPVFESDETSDLCLDCCNEQTRSKYRKFISYGIWFIDNEDFMFVFNTKKDFLSSCFFLRVAVICPRCSLHFEKLLSLKHTLSSMVLSSLLKTVKCTTSVMFPWSWRCSYNVT